MKQKKNFLITFEDLARQVHGDNWRIKDQLLKFYQLEERTGIKAYPHLFRHTFATRMLQSGYLDQYVQQLLGHKSIATTKDIYSHVIDEMSLNTYLEGEEKE